MILESLVVAGLAALGLLGNELRPSVRARRRARRALRRVVREERARQRLEESVVDDLRRSLRRWDEARRRERLTTRPVEELREFGAENVRWGALHDAGIRTVADVAAVRPRKLTRLSGIGDVSTRKIVAARARMLAANREDPVAPPQVADTSRDARDLVRGAHAGLAVRDALGTAPGELERFAAPLRERADAVARGTRLLAPRAEKEAAIAESRRLVVEVDASERDGAVARHRKARERARHARTERPSGEVLRAEHERRYADYCAFLETLLSGRAPRRRTEGGLPGEIADRVETLELRTGLLRLTLRGYQRFGAKFLLVQERALLGDEMGLGKTVQALAAFAHVAEAGQGSRFLVVAPASVVVNWVRETERHTALDAHLLHGDERAATLRRWCAEGGVGVTSFRTLQALLQDAADGDPEWPELHGIVVDEAHYVKNRDAVRTRAVVGVIAPVRLVAFLTGTPLENRLDEFREIVGLLQPEVAHALASSVRTTGDLVIGRAAFHRAVAPAYLRRNQDDVLPELPARIDSQDWVELRSEERAMYEDAVRAREIMAMRRSATVGAGAQRSAKLDRLAEILDECRQERRKVLVFSYFLDVLDAVQERFGATRRIDGSTPAAERQAVCDGFAAAPDHEILVAQIAAAGVGLNLQAASVVVLLEPQWKPSTEEQAIARAHRMGQTRPVLVHRLLAKDSVDERLLEVLAEKTELFDAFARDSLIKRESAEATEASITRRVLDAEAARLGLGDGAPPASDTPVSPDLPSG